MSDYYRNLWEKDFESWLYGSDKVPPGKAWEQLLGQYNNVYIYGAGNLGRLLGIYLSRIGIKATGYIDRNRDKIGKELFAGIKGVAIEDISFDSIILVTVESDNGEVIKNCEKYAKKVINASNVVPRKAAFLEDYFKRTEPEQRELSKRIFNVFDKLEDEESKRIYYLVSKGILLSKPYHNLYTQTYCGRNEYFRKEIFTKKYQNFVDCGAYTGDSFFDYIKFVNGSFQNVFLFEMEKESCQVLQERCRETLHDDAGNVFIFNKGISDKKEELCTKSVGFGSLVSGEGEDICSFDSLDNMLENKQVDFIKMDIEGSELAALKGAAETIRINRPDMAICIYHKVEDLWEIPEYISELLPDSKLYIRHCSHYDQDIILYVVN